MVVESKIKVKTNITKEMQIRVFIILALGVWFNMKVSNTILLPASKSLFGR